MFHVCVFQVGHDDGATLLTGGKRPPSCPHGYFIEPTVFVNVKPHMRIWKEEIFGPVLSGEEGCLSRQQLQYVLQAICIIVFTLLCHAQLDTSIAYLLSYYTVGLA